MEQEWAIPERHQTASSPAFKKRQGEMIGSSDSVVTLTENASNNVVAYVLKAGYLSIGQAVTIRSRSRLQQARAVVVRMGESLRSCLT